ncbi:MAG: hypothetical protein JOZ74_13210, partial [Bradyrhizobium sp.]|nr:hypothetical protein [Bradyrhizobium sp.]
IITQPLLELDNTVSAVLLGRQTDPNEHHLYLAGIERYWVQQSETNDCWAASLQTTRDYMGLYHVPQDEMIRQASGFCPSLQSQREGADAYQIAYAIDGTLRRYDMPRTNPHFCSEPKCMIQSLANRHPIIVLSSGHAVVLVGMDYALRPVTNSPEPLVIIKRLFILDPAKEHAEAETWSVFSLCKVDGLLAY